MLDLFFQKPRRLFDYVIRGMNAVGITLIFGVGVWICVDIFCRAVFNYPLMGTMELTKTALPAVVFLTLAYTEQRRRHVQVTLVVQHLPGRLREMVNIIGLSFSALVLSVMCAYMWGTAWESLRIKEYEGLVLRVPTYPTHLIVAFGCTMLCVQFVVDVFKAVRKLRLG
jgi:TRAP-type C4-dicarboxylate transport system permease small subunit